MPRMRFGLFGAVGTHGLAGLAMALALLLVVPACGSDGNPGSPSGGGGTAGGGSSLSPGTMTATIDGVSWSGTITAASIATGNSLVVSGTDRPGSPGATTLALSSPAQVGTQTVGDGNPLVGALGTLPNVSWLAAGPAGSGSMTISTLTATSATGTFFFTLVANPGQGANRVVTNGAFNARIPTP